MQFSKSMVIDEKALQGFGTAEDAEVDRRHPDEELIRRLKAGDELAFEKMMTLYVGDIYGLLLRMTRDPIEAEDLAQETFFKAFKAMKSFRGESGLKTWLYRIAINVSRNRFRRWLRRRRDKTISLDVSDAEGSSMAERLEGTFGNPEEAAVRNETARRLEEALERVPERFRSAVVLRDIEGMSYEEIAFVLKLKPGTVRSRISRGRKELRRLMFEEV